MELEFIIKIDTINKIKEFVSIMMKYSNSATLYSGRYVVDAKSIMGVFSLNLSEPVVLKLDTTGVSGIEISEIEENIDKFIIKEIS